MPELKLDKKETALLVMDCQVDILSMLPAGEKERVLGNLTKAIGAARKAGIRVIYVVVRFREGHPEVSPRNARFSATKAAGRLLEWKPESQICEEIRPNPGEPVVVKKRIGAFTGSDLEVILRSNDIKTLVLTGVGSLGVVESTVRAAFDMDYSLFVIGDCCSDRDPEGHEFAITKLLSRSGSTVISTGDFIKAIS